MLPSDADRRVAEMLFRALCDRSAEQRLTRRLATVTDIAAIAGVAEDAVIREPKPSPAVRATSLFD